MEANSALPKDKIFYHITDVANKFYVVNDDAPDFKAASGNFSEVGDVETGKWYHIVVDVDLDAKTATTNVYLHDTDGTYAPDTEWTTPIATEASTSLIAKDPLALKQIRLVRTASADVYFDNVKLETK